MAFFNLWSSERLSFSLSIVAVISAAITSYYQFFYFNTDFTIHFPESFWVSYEKGARNFGGRLIDDQRFTTKVALMNAGTEFIGLTSCRFFVTYQDESSNLFWSEKYEPLNHYGCLDSLGVMDASDYAVIIKPQEVHFLEFSEQLSVMFTDSIWQTQVNRNNIRESIGEGIRADVHFGMWFKFIDSGGNYSSQRCHLGSLVYSYVDSVGHAMPLTGNLDGEFTYKLDTFKSLTQRHH